MKRILFSACLWVAGVTAVAAQPAVLAQGALTSLNDTVCATNMANVVSFNIQISNTLDGTVTFQGTATAGPLVSIEGTNVADGEPSATTTAAGVFAFTNTGYQTVCATMTTYGSGGVNVTIARGYGASSPPGGTGVGGGDASAANQTTMIGYLGNIDAAMTAAAAQDVPHDDADTGSPVKIGGKALSFGASPTSVGANDRTNASFTRNGQLLILGGDPNVITETVKVAAADGAQTGTAIVSVSTGSKIVVTRASIKCSGDNSVKVDFRLAFDTDATLTSASTTGVVGEIIAWDDVPAGSGFVEGNGSGILGVGADDEDLRYSLSAPTSGSCNISVSYFTISG